jgi:hypothetical protein
MDEKFIKNFCRIITKDQLSDDDVIDFFDVVQNVVSTKILLGYSTQEDTVVTVDVIAYVNDNDENVYEIVLNQTIDQREGDEIANHLQKVFLDKDFDFEASVEI